MRTATQILSAAKGSPQNKYINEEDMKTLLAAGARLRGSRQEQRDHGHFTTRAIYIGMEFMCTSQNRIDP